MLRQNGWLFTSEWVYNTKDTSTASISLLDADIQYSIIDWRDHDIGTKGEVSTAYYVESVSSVSISREVAMAGAMDLRDGVMDFNFFARVALWFFTSRIICWGFYC